MTNIDKRMSKCLGIIIFFGIYLNAFQQLYAIPTFARKYGVSCSTCHVNIPKLNAFGKAFRFNGYRFPKEKKELLAEKPIPLGGKPQKGRWPEKAIWPGEIPSNPPVSIRMELDTDYNSENNEEIIFNFPHELYVLSGGNLGESISFLFELLAYQDGSFGGIRRSFLQFDSPVWNSKLINLKIGKIEIAAVPSSSIRRITMIEDNVVNSFLNGSNQFKLNDPKSGLELWGIKDGRNGGGFYYGIGVVEQFQEEITLANNDSKGTSSKDLYLRLSYKFRGLSLSGESGPVPEGGSWRDDHLRIGFFAYSGGVEDSDFSRKGADLGWQFKDLELFGGIAFGQDSFKDSISTKMSYTAYFIEGNYVILPWLIGSIRWDIASTPDVENDNDLQNLLLNLSFSLRPNVVFRVETLKQFKGEDSFIARARFDFAF